MNRKLIEHQIENVGKINARWPVTMYFDWAAAAGQERYTVFYVML